MTQMIESRKHNHLHALAACCILLASSSAGQTCIVFGPYSSTPTVAYTCGFGSVSFSYTGWTFTNFGGGNIRITGSPSGSVPPMVGPLNCTDSTFNVSVTIAGSCTETYSIHGTFTSDTSWSGTFRAMFTPGQPGACFDCTNQTFTVSGTTPHVSGVLDGSLPIETTLDQNFPNPFNPSTQIRFSLARTGHAVVSIFNVLGQHVETLVSAQTSAGVHVVLWNPLNVPGGVYFYRLQAGQFSQTRHLMYLK